VENASGGKKRSPEKHRRSSNNNKRDGNSSRRREESAESGPPSIDVLKFSATTGEVVGPPKKTSCCKVMWSRRIFFFTVNVIDLVLVCFVCFVACWNELFFTRKLTFCSSENFTNNHENWDDLPWLFFVRRRVFFSVAPKSTTRDHCDDQPEWGRGGNPFVCLAHFLYRKVT